MGDQNLTLVVESDRASASCAASSERVVGWTISAPDIAHQADRVALKLALVLDRSGSMQGDKLRYVQQAACHVLALLDTRDQVALVTYDDHVTVVAPSTAVTEDARRQLQAQVRALTPGGLTDLGGGWLAGCQVVSTELAATQLGRVLLLTDGLANCGLTDPEELQTHASELRQRSVATSTFGVGRDFNEHLLEGLATKGGGHFYYIAQPAQIPEIFRSELGELLTIVAREAVLAINVPMGLRLRVLGDLPHEQADGQLRVFLGDLYAGERREVYMRALLPTDAPGTRIVLRGTVSYADCAGTTVVVAAELGFHYCNEADVLRSPVHERVLQRASEVELATAASHALRLERVGKWQEAQQALSHAIAACGSAVPTSTLASYQRLSVELETGLTEAQHKQLHFAAYCMRLNRREDV